MGFLSVCTAIYDYLPQNETELEIHEGELLYILEKSSEDAWWKAKKRATEDDEDEPEGLIPNNYVEEATPSHSAKALYYYTRQTDEEVSFEEDAALEVYDISDPDWTLVGLNGDYGFAPANYIELLSTAAPKSPSIASSRHTSAVPRGYAEAAAETADEPNALPRSPQAAAQGPAAALARVLGGGAPQFNVAAHSISSSSPPVRHQFTPEASDEELDEPAPALPRRPPSEPLSPPSAQYGSPLVEEPPGVLPSPPYNRATHHDVNDDTAVQSSGGFHLYNINEMVSAMGKRKKMPTTLGLNLATGIIMISPEKSRDGPSQEWTAEKLTHYSIEGKHVFIELIKPSKSLDLHAGAKDTAEEIVSALGDLAGVVRGGGIQEVIAAAASRTGQKKGQVLYDFMAQGDDEVTVGAGDEVIVLDDTKSEEWWMIRRLKNGNEGVVPSSYVEITGTVPNETPSRLGLNAGRSTVEQNRLEEERLAKEAAKSDRSRDESSSGRPEVRGVEVVPPQRGSSLPGDDGGRRSSHREKRSSRPDGKSNKPKPDPNKTRTWTDRSGSFKVEAQFIGLTDGKIHLHKQNGVKIAVPVTKMAVEDLEYVELATGVSLDEDKPLAEVRRKSQSSKEKEAPRPAQPPQPSQPPPPSQASPTKPARGGATMEQPKAPEYDWFDFFLKAGVGPYQCERYAQNMTKDSMDESVLPDITPEVLRNLGLKEGDILKVMKFLDNKYGRTASKSKLRSVSFAEDGSAEGEEVNGTAGGMFSGPGGALRNNTSRGRPSSNRNVSDVVDPKAFEQSEEPKAAPAEPKATPTAPPVQEKVQTGFDDDAWEVKPPKQAAPAPRPERPSSVPQAPPVQPALTGALAELSLLSPPLQPTSATPQPAPQPVPQQIPQQPPPLMASAPRPPSAPVQQPQATGANPSFFSQLNQQQTGVPPAQGGFASAPQFQPQSTGIQLGNQANPPRQRPQAPQSFGPGGLLPPPPRPLSAPQNFTPQNQFGPPPLQPQLTGIPHASPSQTAPGQSLNELSQQRFHQQYGQQLQAQQTGFMQPGPGMTPFTNGIQPQHTGFQQYGNYPQQQAFVNGNMAGSPFADPRPSFQQTLSSQPTGYNAFSPQGLPPGGINSVLPPALQPQQTGFSPQPQQTGFQPPQPPQQTGFQQAQQPQSTGFQQPQPTGFGQPPQQNGFTNQGFQPPPMPPMPQQQSIAPLQPQKTGPAPPVRFGVEPPKLTPQPTGRRANLSQATPQNPFGF